MYVGQFQARIDWLYQDVSVPVCIDRSYQDVFGACSSYVNRIGVLPGNVWVTLTCTIQQGRNGYWETFKFYSVLDAARLPFICSPSIHVC